MDNPHDQPPGGLLQGGTRHGGTSGSADAAVQALTPPSLDDLVRQLAERVHELARGQLEVNAHIEASIRGLTERVELLEALVLPSPSWRKWHGPADHRKGDHAKGGNASTRGRTS